MKNKKVNLLKVVYFDEGSAIDYLDVYHGGLKNETLDKTKNIKTFFKPSAKIKAKSGILFKALQPFLGLDATGGVEGGFSRIGKSAIKMTISNTVLSDFIETAEDDSNIKKMLNYAVSAYENSISFIKMYTPYLNMLKMENESIDITKLDETLEKGKGYYELLAEHENKTRKVLRFNMKAFRNNYGLVDLPKMKLKFYSVKVGSMEVATLNAEKEFDFNKKDKIVTSSEILKGHAEEKEQVSVFDVILSGIQADG